MVVLRGETKGRLAPQNDHLPPQIPERRNDQPQILERQMEKGRPGRVASEGGGADVGGWASVARAGDVSGRSRTCNLQIRRLGLFWLSYRHDLRDRSAVRATPFRLEFLRSWMCPGLCATRTTCRANRRTAKVASFNIGAGRFERPRRDSKSRGLPVSRRPRRGLADAVEGWRTTGELGLKDLNLHLRVEGAPSSAVRRNPGERLEREKPAPGSRFGKGSAWNREPVREDPSVIKDH